MGPAAPAALSLTPCPSSPAEGSSSRWGFPRIPYVLIGSTWDTSEAHGWGCPCGSQQALQTSTQALGRLHPAEQHLHTQQELAQRPCCSHLRHVGCQHELPQQHTHLSLLTPAPASKRKRLGSKAGGAESRAPAFPQRQNTSQPRPCQDKRVRAPESASLRIAEPPANTLPTCQPCSSTRRNVFGKAPHFFRAALPQTRRLARPAAPSVQHSPAGLGEAFASSAQGERQRQGCTCPSVPRDLRRGWSRRWARQSPRDVACESRVAGRGVGPGPAPQRLPPPSSILAASP